MIIDGHEIDAGKADAILDVIDRLANAFSEIDPADAELLVPYWSEIAGDLSKPSEIRRYAAMYALVMEDVARHGRCSRDLAAAFAKADIGLGAR